MCGTARFLGMALLFWLDFGLVHTRCLQCVCMPMICSRNCLKTRVPQASRRESLTEKAISCGSGDQVQ